ncbi:MarR family winged helix-turn-helix transcriptional regulator [Streptomyces aidingensis]|uniref:DNA-binding transcriptional regulator, MarR family n=1 Tax=Streptomyces aidingensis TaxID=910347 RepID=A0A1I1G1E5_9ACTN|nr:MarR family winged helix-turn-helix transcriptional regulator [Streptomyces aidingensis]SFC03123.1 DNA-binding transcriptional regulator, MarR family [Streptomyces aidingensis]
MSPPPKSVDPVTVEVIELIGTVVARYHEEYDQAAAAHGLTGAQARLLALLALEPTPMRRLAHRLRCEPSNVTGIMDRLVARGLAERRTDPADGRVKIAAATERGLRTARALRAGLGFARAPLAGLSPEERTTLRDLLRRILDTPPGRAPGRVPPDGPRRQTAAG